MFQVSTNYSKIKKSSTPNFKLCQCIIDILKLLWELLFEEPEIHFKVFLTTRLPEIVRIHSGVPSGIYNNGCTVTTL